MTTQEHNLILGLLAKQMQTTEILLKMLESHGLIQNDDIEAFEFAVSQDDVSNADVLRRATERYLALAKALGIETGLKNP